MPRGLAPSLEQRIGSIVGRVSLWLALAGGLLLLGLSVMTLVSVIWSIRGDFELVSAGTAIAVFFFLPYAQYRRGHVVVEIFVAWAGPRLKAFLAILGNVLMTAAALLIAWRLQIATLDKVGNGQTTFMLAMPVWWAYAACAVGAWATVLTSLYTVWRSINEWLGGGEPPSEHAEIGVA